MTNSVRPSSEAIRTGTLAVTLASERGGRPAMRRSTGTIMSWKVNIAEVGNPGRMTTGLPSQTARHNGFSGVCGEAPRDEPGGDVARAFRGAARQHQHVADCKRRAHGSFECFFIVGNGAEKHRVAA